MHKANFSTLTISSTSRRRFSLQTSRTQRDDVDIFVLYPVQQHVHDSLKRTFALNIANEWRGETHTSTQTMNALFSHTCETESECIVCKFKSQSPAFGRETVPGKGFGRAQRCETPDIHIQRDAVVLFITAGWV